MSPLPCLYPYVRQVTQKQAGSRRSYPIGCMTGFFRIMLNITATTNCGTPTSQAMPQSTMLHPKSQPGSKAIAHPPAPSSPPPSPRHPRDLHVLEGSEERGSHRGLAGKLHPTALQAATSEGEIPCSSPESAKVGLLSLGAYLGRLDNGLR